MAVDKGLVRRGGEEEKEGKLREVRRERGCKGDYGIKSCVCARACMHTHAWGMNLCTWVCTHSVNMHRGQRLTLGVFLNHSPVCFETRSPTGL